MVKKPGEVVEITGYRKNGYRRGNLITGLLVSNEVDWGQDNRISVEEIIRRHDSFREADSNLVGEEELKRLPECVQQAREKAIAIREEKTRTGAVGESLVVGVIRVPVNGGDNGYGYRLMPYAGPISELGGSYVKNHRRKRI